MDILFDDLHQCSFFLFQQITHVRSFDATMQADFNSLLL